VRQAGYLQKGNYHVHHAWFNTKKLVYGEKVRMTLDFITLL